MRIQFKCSCGAEAMWCNDDDCQVDRDHVERYASEWLADHAKCREAARSEPVKECEHTYGFRSNTTGNYMECTKCLHRVIT